MSDWANDTFLSARNIIRACEQLESNIHALDVELDAPALARLDEIFPPVGHAPQAYAW